MSPDNANGQLRHGQVLADRYLIEELIGQGGMAEVYKGRDNRLARPVALKVLRGHYALDPELRSRFEEEARAAALVSHPNVVAVYDAGEDDSKAFIVMELVQGETLYDAIARGPMEVSLVRSIGGQVLDALGAAHERGVLHRDIKPANVLLTPEGQVKVADFGIAKAIHPSPDAVNHTTMNMVLGTPSYLAPERAQGHPATAASDLWAVGVLLYESVTGAKPFLGDNPIAITLAAQQARFTPVRELRPDVDPALAAVIERAINPSPEMRFSSAREMASALSNPALDATQILGGDFAPGPAGLSTTQVIGAPTERDGGLGAGALAGAALGGAALGGAGAAAAGSRLMSADRDGDGPSRRPRRGMAVLAGAGVAVLLGAIVALAMLLPSSSHNNPGNTGNNTPTTTKPSLSRTATSTSPPTSSIAPTTTTSSTTTTTTRPPTTTTTTTGAPTTTTTTAPATTTTTTPATTSTTLASGSAGSSTTTTTPSS